MKNLRLVFSLLVVLSKLAYANDVKPNISCDILFNSIWSHEFDCESADGKRNFGHILEVCQEHVGLEKLRDGMDLTVLHHSASVSATYVFDYLLTFWIKNKLNINVTGGSKSMSPAHCAAKWDNLANFELLQAKGADMSLKDKQGKTPSDYLQNENRVLIAEKN